MGINYEWFRNIITSDYKIGVVSDIDDGDVTARVTFDDRITSLRQSYQLLWKIRIRMLLLDARYWWASFVYLSSRRAEQGFILGSFYDETQKPPSNTLINASLDLITELVLR